MRNRVNKGSIGVILGDNFANFFYTEIKETRCIVEKATVRELLSNKDFLIAIQDFISKINNQINRECSTPNPIYSPAS